MGGGASKNKAIHKRDDFVPPEENKEVALHIDFGDDSDGEDSMEIERTQVTVTLTLFVLNLGLNHSNRHF